MFLLLSIEARRYRFFDVYRARVRQLERNYFAEVFAPSPGVAGDWAHLLAEDLRDPQFLMTHMTAMSRRLRRNYIWMFLVLLLAWLLKISSSKLQHEGVSLDIVQSAGDILRNATLGLVPGWIVFPMVTVFYAWLLYITLRRYQSVGELAHGKVHV